MSFFYLVRHGQKDSTRIDPSLTPVGFAQARRTSTYLSQFPIVRVVASPKQRTLQTAAQIASPHGIAVEPDHRLLERMDFESSSYADRTAFFQDWMQASADRTYVPKSGMSSLQTADLVRTVLAELDDGSQSHIVVVTHGGAIADYLRSTFSEMDYAHLYEDYREGRDVRIDECSVTIIETSRSAHLLRQCHYCGHLNVQC